MTFLIVFFSTAIAVINDLITWGILSSKSYIKKFGPTSSKKDPYLSEDEKIEKQRKNGLSSELTRTIVLSIISLATIGLFGKVDLYSAITQNYLIMSFILMGVVYGLVYHGYVGPKRLAEVSDQSITLFSKRGFREYFVPYLVDLVGFYAVILGILGVLIINIVVRIQNNYNELLNWKNELTNLLQNPGINLADHQIISIRLVAFGDWISSASQKFLVVSLLLLFFIIIVQSSYLKRTVFQASINKYKLVFWIIVIASLSFSAIYLPSQFNSMHNNAHNSLQELTISYQNASTTSTDELSNLLSLEDFLLDHDTNWLILKIFSGYGNIAVAITLIGGILIKNIFMSEVSTIEILSLLLPSGLFERVKNYFARIGMKI